MQTIPYVSKITLSLTPETFSVSIPFNVTCTVSVIPSRVAHNVTFQRNEKVFGVWTRQNVSGLWAWQNVSAIAGATVVADKLPLPFSVVVKPQTKEAAGQYRCSAEVSVGINATQTFSSISVNNYYNGSVDGCFFSLSTAIVALLATFLATL